jgi:hypothetical protein
VQTKAVGESYWFNQNQTQYQEALKEAAGIGTAGVKSTGGLGTEGSAGTPTINKQAWIQSTLGDVANGIGFFFFGLARSTDNRLNKSPRRSGGIFCQWH